MRSMPTKLPGRQDTHDSSMGDNQHLSWSPCQLQSRPSSDQQWGSGSCLEIVHYHLFLAIGREVKRLAS